MRNKKLPPGHWMNMVPVLSGPEVLQVNLTQLSPEKRRPVWQRIQQHSPKTAALLSSTEFQQTKAELEAVFGPVDISVELATLGEDNDGIC